MKTLERIDLRDMPDDGRRRSPASLLRRWIAVGACVLCAPARAGDPNPGTASRKPLSAAEESALAGHLKAAFEEGFVVGPRRQQEANRHLNLARRAAPGDPRIDYAHGLVLLKQSQLKPAIAQFEAALKQDGGRYWPAWRAAIWGHLVAKQYEAGLNQLDEFAATVQAAEKPDEISEAQRDAARWIGELIEALSRCIESRQLHDLLAAHQVKVLNTLGEQLSQAVEAGQDSIRDREFALEQAAGAARQVADKGKERRRQDKATKLEKDLAGVSKAKETAARTAEEWKAWLDDTLAKADKQLGTLERDYKFLDQRAQSLTQSITLVGREITNIQLGMSFLNPKNNSNADYTTAAQLNNQFVLQQRQNQMFAYQSEYNATVGRMEEVARQGSQTMQERADAVQQYETATGQLVKKSADLDKWSGRLKNQRQKLTVQKPAARGGQKAPDKKQQFSLKTYLPLDLERERNQILASLVPADAEPDEKTAAVRK